ncbi:MAG: PIN domain-containing protein [Candidatus Hydrothermarchaeales archaeon]
MPKKAKTKVILDSNFLMLPFQFNIDIVAEIDRILGGGYEISVPRGVLQELHYMSFKAENLNDRKMAKMAIEFGGRFNIIEGEAEDADEAIASLADEDTIVCTNDRALKSRLRRLGVPVMYLRQKNRLELEGYGVP